MCQNTLHFSILLCLTPDQLACVPLHFTGTQATDQFACECGEFCIQFNNWMDLTGMTMLLERLTFH